MQLNEQEAIAFAESKAYERMTAREIVLLQVSQDKLCVPFDVFHKAMQDVLDRPIFTHEFGSESVYKEVFKLL